MDNINTVMACDVDLTHLGHYIEVTHEGDTVAGKLVYYQHGTIYEKNAGGTLEPTDFFAFVLEGTDFKNTLPSDSMLKWL